MTPDEARDLLKNTTPGPWRLQEVKGYPHLRHITTGEGHSGDPTAAVCIHVDVTSREGAANMAAKAAVPSMLAMIAGMREEWAVQVRRSGRWQWSRDEDDFRWQDLAVQMVRTVRDHPDEETRLVRRYVTEPEEA